MERPCAVFGDVALHVTIRGDRDAEFTVGDVELDAGGGCAVVARQLAALGCPTTMFGVSGDDPVGERIRAELVAEGIDCAHWVTAPGPTARVAIQVGTPGAERVVVRPGPGDCGRRLVTLLGTLAGDPAVETRTAGLAYVPGFPGYGVLRRSLVAEGVDVVSDYGFRPWLTDFPTARGEIPRRTAGARVAVLSGSGFSLAENTVLAEACLAHGAVAVVTTMGSGGCLVVAASGRDELRAPRVDPVNTLGAGDSFAAGLLAGLSRGLAVRDAADHAQRVAAAKVTTLTGPALPDTIQLVDRPDVLAESHD